MFWARRLGLSVRYRLSRPQLCSPSPQWARCKTRLHGVVVKDPYRYMENVKAPEVQTWIRAQGAYSREVLDQIAVRDGLEKRLTELTSANGDAIGGMVRMPGDKIFYMLRPKGERQFKLAMRTGFAGAARVLVDPEVAAKATRRAPRHQLLQTLVGWPLCGLRHVGWWLGRCLALHSGHDHRQERGCSLRLACMRAW